MEQSETNMLTWAERRVWPLHTCSEQRSAHWRNSWRRWRAASVSGGGVALQGLRGRANSWTGCGSPPSLSSSLSSAGAVIEINVHAEQHFYTDMITDTFTVLSVQHVTEAYVCQAETADGVIWVVVLWVQLHNKLLIKLSLSVRRRPVLSTFDLWNDVRGEKLTVAQWGRRTEQTIRRSN